MEYYITDEIWKVIRVHSLEKLFETLAQGHWQHCSEGILVIRQGYESGHGSEKMTTLGSIRTDQHGNINFKYLG